MSLFKNTFKLLAPAVAGFAISTTTISAKSIEQPNIIIIFADDLGYGDLSCFGHPTIATPHLDQMAAEGQKWADFYAAAPICSPSRAGLLTGRYPIRSGTSSSVFFEWSAGGLPPEEETIAEVLKKGGYQTAAVGKWHLGHKEQYLPTKQGFDSYYGIPYSNDMRHDCKMRPSKDIILREGMTLETMQTPGNKVNHWVPLLKDTEVIEYPCDQTTLTEQYTQKCIEFIEENKDQPFFLYYAQAFPHVPLFASDKFLGSSRRGLYGDVVEEMDASIGRILETLRKHKLDENTLVVFTSDNGPWETKDQNGGSAGLLRGAKGQTWEGGMRVPTIFWWPGKIEGGTVVRELASTLDLMATAKSLADVSSNNSEMDSHDLSGVLLENEKSPRELFYYYRGTSIYAVRYKEWKAHFITQGSFGRGGERVMHKTPLLFNLHHDPSEQYNIAESHPEIVEKLIAFKTKQEGSIVLGTNQYKAVVDYQILPERAKSKK